MSGGGGRGVRVVAVVAVLGVMVSLLVGSARLSKVERLVAQADAAATPVLDWAPCADQALARLECATAAVPVDYDRPRGATLRLALVRQQASDPVRRIGTLLRSAGGPGNSAIDGVRNRGHLGDGELAQRFDIVAFDQRGVGESGQVRCFSDPDEQARYWSTLSIPPITSAEEQAAERAARALAAGCARHSPALLPNVATVDAARDLDLLRRALGDDKLTYQGGSYASYLAEVYGALFGDRVRALSLGAIVDPVSYTVDPVRHLTERAVGTQEVFAEFARLCEQAGKPRCAFAGPNILGRNAELLSRLKQGPIVVGDGENATSPRYADVMMAHTALLYDATERWPVLAELLTQLELGHAGDADTVRAILAAIPITNDMADSYVAISCADMAFARNGGRWRDIAAQAQRTAGDYGPYWLATLQACGSWRELPQRHTGPWTLRSQTPALLTAVRYDPATPLRHAVAATEAVVNARLVVVDGHGHGTTTTCSDAIAVRYLIDLRLPESGTRCPVDTPPFS